MLAFGKRKERELESTHEREIRLARRRIRRYELQRLNTLNLAEQHNMNQRLARVEQTRVRNEEGQRRVISFTNSTNVNKHDDNQFYKTIDHPLTFICGSCGELSNASSVKVLEYNEGNPFFLQLAVPGDRGLINEAIVKDANGKERVPFCEPCYTSLQNKTLPKFCRSSGFYLGKVPEELAKLNDMEARMIGLGITFTTCYRLRGGGQSATRGNSISYWHQMCSTVSKLPRPISKCGVIYLRSNGQHGGIYEVRPNYIRAALHWLTQNNPLYASIDIDEELLQQLQEASLLPDLVIEDDEVESDTIATINDEHANYNVQSASDDYDHVQSLNEWEGNCIESFEMQTGDSDCQTESDRVLNMLLEPNSTQPETSTIQPLNVTINEYTTRTIMQQCFPTLFPTGFGGYHPLGEENRQYTYTLAEYCAHLMMWHDRRFVIHPTFKFFCLNLIQRRQVDGLTKKVHPENIQQNMTTNPTNDEIKHVLKQLKPYFRTIRGSGLYWATVRSELMAMLGSEALPVRWPTFFFTLSSADTIWPDFFRACNPALSLNDASHLSSDERNRYLNQYPDIAARHFYRRFQALMSNIIMGKNEPLGHVVDYFWRVEFQKRGSPHVHGLLWIEGAPDVQELSKTEEGRFKLAQFVDKYVHAATMTSEELCDCECNLCLNERNNIENPDILTLRAPLSEVFHQCDLRRVVDRVQQHICFPTSICHEKKGYCRFAFPKPLQEVTKINFEHISDCVPRIDVLCRRNNPFINNFNASLIVRWRANMDIKLIGNAYGAAEYTAAYCSKAEPDTSRFREAIRKALGRSSPSDSAYTMLRRVANATIAVREISAQEAMWILLPGLMMTGKSRTVVKVKTLRHNKRSEWISREDCLRLACNSNSTHCNTQPKIDALERMYMARPMNDTFLPMTYKYFCEHYEESKTAPKPNQQLNRFKRTDHLGYIKARKHARVILKCPGIKANFEDPDYCFQELLLRSSWTNISDLPTDDDQCIARFSSFRSASTSAFIITQENIERENAMQVLNSQETAIESRLQTTEWEFEDPRNSIVNELPLTTSDTNSFTCCSSEEYNRAERFIFDEVLKAANLRQTQDHSQQDYTHYLYPIGLDSFNMNEDQWVAFAICMQQARARKNLSSQHTALTPLNLILNGEGGSGKSWLINHIVKDTYRIFDGYQKKDKLRVLLMAHQGSAAFNIGGSTICSALAIPRNFSNDYVPFRNNNRSLPALKRLQEKYENVHLVIIDEFSVISCTLLRWIDLRLRELFPYDSDKPFGGRDIILAGDMGQLAPVRANSLCTPQNSLRNSFEAEGRKTWTNFTTVCTLQSQNRGLADEEWYNALRRLRSMDETLEDIKLFNTRVKSRLLHPNWTNATHIAYTNETINITNEQCLIQQQNPIFELHSYYSYSEKDPSHAEQINIQMLNEIYSNVMQPKQNRDNVVQPIVRLAKGASVALTYNVAQAAGLCNGTKGVVHDIITCPGKKLPIILVRITDKYFGPSFLQIPKIIPIVPKSIACPIKNDFVRVTRIGIPLRLAYGMTIHKVQGLTCSKVVFNPSSIPFSSFAYVALSRVRNREDILLTEPIIIPRSPSHFKHKHILKSEFARLANLSAITKRKHQNTIRVMQHAARSYNNSL